MTENKSSFQSDNYQSKYTPKTSGLNLTIPNQIDENIETALKHLKKD